MLHYFFCKGTKNDCKYKFFFIYLCIAKRRHNILCHNKKNLTWISTLYPNIDPQVTSPRQ